MGIGWFLLFLGPCVLHQSGPNPEPLLVSQFTLVWG